MPFRRRILSRRLRALPMLKALAPLCAGIVLAERFAWPVWWLAGGFAVCWLLAGFRRSGAAACGAILLFGMIVATVGEERSPIPFGHAGSFAVEVADYPVDRGSYATVPARVTAWRPDGRACWEAVRARVMLYADSALSLSPGERILCRSRLRDFSSRYSGYRARMHRDGFAGSLSLSDGQIAARESGNIGGIAALHAAASERLRRLPLESAARGVVLAVAAGDKTLLSADLRSRYARSGTAHLLAVSGLHVGLLFLMVNALSGWMVLLPAGHRWRNLTVVAAVWLYAAAAGLPASAVRAACMFSVLQFSLFSDLRYDSINALCATAFVMLAVRPAYLFDTGFQLSFLSVGAIVAWAVPLCRRLRLRSRPERRAARLAVWIVNRLFATLIVGAAATLATAPLIARMFGMVTAVGILVTPLLVLFVTVTIAAALVWVALPVGAAAPLFGAVIGTAAGVQNRIVGWAAAVPAGAVEAALPAAAAAGCYVVFGVATLLVWSYEAEKSAAMPPAPA